MNTINHDAYRDWFNDFLTIAGFADYYGLDDKKAKKMIRKGRVIEADLFPCHALPTLTAEKDHEY